MLEFRKTEDPHVEEVWKEGQAIATLQWHPARSPTMVCRPNVDEFTLGDLDEMIIHVRLCVKAIRPSGIAPAPREGVLLRLKG